MEHDEQAPRRSFRDRVVQAVKDDLGLTPEGRAQAELEKERNRAHWQWLQNTFAGVVLEDGQIDSPHGGGPVAGARAVVDTVGQLTARITATRLVLTGPLALGWRKRVDTRELYLMIEGVGWAISVPVDPDQGPKARAFAAKVNAAASAAAASKSPTDVGAEPDIADQIRKLGELRDAGILTEDEFATKKTQLLERL